MATVTTATTINSATPNCWSLERKAGASSLTAVRSSVTKLTANSNGIKLPASEAHLLTASLQGVACMLPKNVAQIINEKTVASTRKNQTPATRNHGLLPASEKTSTAAYTILAASVRR